MRHLDTLPCRIVLSLGSGMMEGPCRISGYRSMSLEGLEVISLLQHSLCYITHSPSTPMIPPLCRLT